MQYGKAMAGKAPYLVNQKGMGSRAILYFLLKF